MTGEAGGIIQTTATGNIVLGGFVKKRYIAQDVCIAVADKTAPYATLFRAQTVGPMAAHTCLFDIATEGIQAVPYKGRPFMHIRKLDKRMAAKTIFPLPAQSFGMLG
jgi:hypothetical protein